MAMYCMCVEEGAENFDEDNQVEGAPNRFVGTDDNPTRFPRVMLRFKMDVIKTGAEQVLPTGQRHYPNVDVYQCANCKAVVVKE